MDFRNASLVWTSFEIQEGQRPSAMIGIGVLILLTLVLVYSTKSRGSYFKDGNGNRVKELGTNTRFTRFTKSRELSEAGRELAGNDPYIIRNGKFRELVLGTPDQLRDFYRKDTKDHPKPKNLNMGGYFGRALGQCVGAVAGQKWKIIRNHFDPEFSHQASTKIIPTFYKEICRWCDELSKDSQHVPLADGGFIANVIQAFKFLPLRLLAIRLYGEAFDEEVFSKLLELYSLHQRVVGDIVMGERMIPTWFNYLPTPEKKRMDSYLREWRTFNLNIIRHARERQLECPVERIFRGVDQGGQMREEEFLQTLDEIIFANVDISASVLNTLLVNLAGNKPFQKGLRTEVAEHNWPNSYDITQYVAKQSSHLNYLVMESMRLTPPFRFTFPECTAIDKVIGKYHIPAKTAIIIDAVRINTDPVTWGPDGETFRPERFADMPLSQCQYGMVRFGVGGASGKCLGRHVADIVFKLTTLAILGRYIISPAKGNGEDKVEGTAAPSPEIEFRRI